MLSFKTLSQYIHQILILKNNLKCYLIRLSVPSKLIFKALFITLEINILTFVFVKRNRLITINSSGFQEYLLSNAFDNFKQCNDSTCNIYISCFNTLNLENGQIKELICASLDGIPNCIIANNLRNSFENTNTYENKHIIVHNNSLASSSIAIFTQNNATYSFNVYKIDSSTASFKRSRGPMINSNKFNVIHSIETNDKIILFENSYEQDTDSNEPKIFKARLSQICKSELNDFIWQQPENNLRVLTSYLSTYLDCYVSSSIKLSRLIHVTNPVLDKMGRKLIYASFSSNSNELTGTAICVYDLNDINQIFTKDNLQYKPGTSIATSQIIDFSDCNINQHSKFGVYKIHDSLDVLSKSVQQISSVNKALYFSTNGYIVTYFVVYAQDIIFATTDNGLILHLIRKNDNDFKLVNEIKMFNEDTVINGIQIIDNQKLLLVTNNQLKILSLDFCKLRSNSCQKCVEQNENSDFSTLCYWFENSCSSDPRGLSLIESCNEFLTTTTSSNQNLPIYGTSRSLPINNITQNNTLNDIKNSAPQLQIVPYVAITVALFILGISFGLLLGYCCLKRYFKYTYPFKKPNTYLNRTQPSELSNSIDLYQENHDFKQYQKDFNKLPVKVNSNETNKLNYMKYNKPLSENDYSRINDPISIIDNDSLGDYPYSLSNKSMRSSSSSSGVYTNLTNSDPKIATQQFNSGDLSSNESLQLLQLKRYFDTTTYPRNTYV